MIIGNEEEAVCLMKKFTEKDSSATLNQSLVEFYKSKFKHAVITLGPKGVVLILNNESTEIKSYEVEPLDLTGAGDLFTANYLYSVICHNDHKKGAERGCYLASKLIQQVGARLEGDLKSVWQS